MRILGGMVDSRLLRLSTLFVIVVVWAAANDPAASQQDGQTRSRAATGPIHLRIPRQPLPAALSSFAEQTGFQVVYRTEEVSATVTSPAVSGTYTLEAALARLLADSGLEFYRINDRTIGIRTTSLPTSKIVGAPQNRAAQ